MKIFSVGRSEKYFIFSFYFEMVQNVKMCPYLS